MATDLDRDTDDDQLLDDAFVGTEKASQAWQEPTVRCPNCETDIKLTESLAAPLIETLRAKYEQKLSRQQADIAQREATIKDRESAIERAKQAIGQQVEEQVAEKLNAECAKIAAREAQQARRLVEADLAQRAQEITNLQEILQQRETKLAEAQKAQADLVRKEQELIDAKREMDLTVANRVRESLDAERQKGKQQAEDELKLKVVEKELTIASMQRQIQELQRKAEQGSQQLQGEAQEVELETVLCTRFPHDSIEPVAKGEHGGDVLQHVRGPLDQECGRILWESKRTKSWNDGWLAKLRDDQRTAKAEIAVIVSQTLPKDCETFNLIDGIWVTSSRCMIPVATALRHSLIELATARQAGEGQQTKMELVYQYLTGPRFRHRIQAVVEKFADMHADLEKERKTMTRLWAKREEQIRCVVESTAGMYGDLQGIAGRTLQEIEGLEFPLLDVSEGDGTPATNV